MTLMPTCDILDVCNEGKGAHSVSVTYSCYGMGSGPGGGGRSIVGSGFPWDAEDMHIFLVVECVGCSHTHTTGERVVATATGKGTDTARTSRTTGPVNTATRLYILYFGESSGLPHLQQRWRLLLLLLLLPLLPQRSR